MTVTPPKFIAKPLEASVIEKIELSLSQCENIEFREILCPYCSTTLATVTINMREGFIVAKCQKCMATFDTEPDYTGFTAENLSTINREIEGYMVDMEAERAGDAYEAEYGADGYRMFPGNAPEADSEETAMPTLQEEKPKPKKAITTFHPEIPLEML